METANVGRVLVVVGLGTALLGALLWGLSALAPGFRLGRLPGDIVIENEGSKVFIPVTTMVLASLLLTLIVWLVGVLRR
jgi:hypothetical protein